MYNYNNTWPSPEIVVTPPDSDDSDHWFSSPTCSTNGRSSISSIPWAEDAIQQNQDEWEHIERMLYGEEPLPTDPKLRNEFSDWMTKFPHLRVIGQTVPFHFDCCAVPSDLNYEETIALDPMAQCWPMTNRESLNNRSLFQRRCLKSTLAHKESQQAIELSDRRLSNVDQYQLDKCIRITSGPILSRSNRAEQYNVYRREQSHRKVGRIIPSIKELSPIRIASVKSDVYNRRGRSDQQAALSHLKNSIYMESLCRPELLSSNSLLKMPPILSVTGIQSRQSMARTTLGGHIKLLKPLPALQKSRISLPSITPLMTSTTTGLGRSVSAFSKKWELGPNDGDDGEIVRKLSKLNV